MSVQIIGNSTVIVDKEQVFEICDDCGEAYMGPAYYTWDVDVCTVTDGNGNELPHECTFNTCPDCSGYLEPDYEDDPRRPELGDASLS